MIRFLTAVVLSGSVLLSVGQVAEAGGFEFQTTFGGSQLASPFGTAVDAAGDVYVTNFTSSGSITEFDSHMNFMRTVGGGTLQWPNSVAVGPSGTIYALEGSRVQSFAANGTAGLSFGSLSGAFGIAVNNASDVYVADTGNNRIIEFDSAGNLLATIAPPSGDSFHNPYGVAVDAAGELYVADTFADRVMIFDDHGAFVRSFTTDVAGWPDTHPKELVVADDGTIYMSLGDPGLAEFSDTGTLLDTYQGAGGLAFDRASGVALAGTTLYAADLGNNRLQVFSVPEPSALVLLAIGGIGFFVHGQFSIRGKRRNKFGKVRYAGK